MDKQTLQKYDPANAKNLTPEDIAAMKDFTNDDLLTLAQLFPNKAQGGAYLIIGNTNMKVQTGNRGTFQNLYNLKVKNGQKQFFAMSYTSLFRVAPKQPAIGKLVDLTNEEIKQRPGFGAAIAAKQIKEKVQTPTAKEQVAAGATDKNTGAEDQPIINNDPGEDFTSLDKEAAKKIEGAGSEKKTEKTGKEKK